MAQTVLSASAPNEALAPHVRLFTAGVPASEAPKWYYQDLQGQLQGPFDASTMSRWCGEGALPGDLKCLGIHSQDSSLGINSAVLTHFQPLSKLLENTRAGIQYVPVRLGKGPYNDDGPATPQSAAPPKGNRAAVPGGPANHTSQPLGGPPITNGGPDVMRAMDQRGTLAAAGGVLAGSGSMNGLPIAAQQQGMQHSALMQHLQQMQQRPASSQQRQQNMAASRRGNQQARSTPNQFPTEQMANNRQQQPGQVSGPSRSGAQPAAAAPLQQQQAADASSDAQSELHPNSEAWGPALRKLLQREGFSGKDADVKWRVILASGDRVGPFSTDQMTDWIVAGRPPKGINKQQAQQTAANPAALQVAGILSSDYNAQRLPGAKFFKPLGALLALVAAGMQYQAVNKHDLQRGLPNKGWNEGVSPAPVAGGKSAPPGPTPTGKGAAKAAAKNNAAGGGNKQGNRNKNQAAQQQKPQGPPSGLKDSGEGPAGSMTSSSSKTSTFKHPMALRQQQRQQQQEALLASAGQAVPGQVNGPSTAGAQLPTGTTGPGGRFGHMAQSSNAARGGVPASNSKGGASGPQATSQQQKQQQQLTGAAAAAQQAAAGRFGQGLTGAQQQFLTPQQQMQAASMSFLQNPQGAAAQAVWLKQQQQMLAGQGPPGAQLAGQALLGYPGMQGYLLGATGAQQMTPEAAAAAASILSSTGLPRTSSTGSSAQQQQQQHAMVGTSGAHPSQLLQQQQMLAGAADLQARAQMRPVTGVPPTPYGQPGILANPQQLQAAVLLFLHDQQQQQPHKPEKAPARWWVQRGNLMFSGPFTGLQMYQAFAQPMGPLRLTDSTAVAAVAAGPVPLGSKDVPSPRAFAPLGCLLEAAAQGFVLVPWPSSAGGRDAAAGPQTHLIQHAATGVTLPLANILSQTGLLALQKQQAVGSVAAEQGEQGTTPKEVAAGGHQQQQQQQMPPTPKHRQQQQQQVSTSMHPSAAAAVGYIQLPNGSLVPAGGLMHLQGAGMAALQANPAVMAVQQPAVDGMAVANALFTAGGQSQPIVWYIRSENPGSDGTQGSGVQGPFDPQEMLTMYRENRLGSTVMLCATHRAAPGQQLPPPPPETFKPLHSLMHTVSTPSSDPMQASAGPTAGFVPGSSSSILSHQSVPSVMMITQGPGASGPMLLQVANSGGPQALPGSSMSGVPHASATSMQMPHGVMMQQQMMAALPTQQQQQFSQQQQQHSQQWHRPGKGFERQASDQARQVADSGPASVGGSSTCAPAGPVAPASGNSDVTSGSSQPHRAGEAQRVGNAPPRVDTWGSLAAQELLQRRPSASSSNGHQAPACGAASQGMDSALGAAVSSRRASIEGVHPQGPHAGMMLPGGPQGMMHMPMQGGPKSTGFIQPGPSSHTGPHVAHDLGTYGPRSANSSSTGRQPQHFMQDSAAAAAAALAGGLQLQGGAGPMLAQAQAHQQPMFMHSAMLSGMTPQSAGLMGMPQQQQHQHAAGDAVPAQPERQGAQPAAASPAGSSPPVEPVSQGASTNVETPART